MNTATFTVIPRPLPIRNLIMNQLNLFQTEDLPLFQVQEPRDMITDVEEWNHIIMEARKEVGRIVRSGGMATKTKVEKGFLMPTFNITHAVAHDIMNHIQHHNLGWL